MLENKSQFIAYIGQKAVKKDTVGGTATIWNGFGDIQEVPHGPAVKLLQHPDIWITAKKFEEKYSENIGSIQNESNDSEVPLSVVGLSSAANSDVQISTQTSAPEVVAPVIPAVEESGDDQPSDKTASIQNAILSLEVGNHEHFSEATGVPLLNAVRTAANDESITVKDLNAVWKALNNSSK